MKKTMNLKDPPLLYQAQELKEFSSTEDPDFRMGWICILYSGESQRFWKHRFIKKPGLFLRQE